MPKYLIAFLLAFAGRSYSQNGSPIKLDYFAQLPKQIDGCSGLYTNDTTPLNKKKYLIITNLQDFAQIKVGGRKMDLNLSSQKQLSNNS
jgi:hypothetical protein